MGGAAVDSHQSRFRERRRLTAEVLLDGAGTPARRRAGRRSRVAQQTSAADHYEAGGQHLDLCEQRRSIGKRSNDGAAGNSGSANHSDEGIGDPRSARFDTGRLAALACSQGCEVIFRPVDWRKNSRRAAARSLGCGADRTRLFWMHALDLRQRRGRPCDR